MTDHSALANLVKQVDALASADRRLFANRCTDPKPTDRDNWVGGSVADGGGVWTGGYDVTDDSTYADQGLYVRSDSGSSDHNFTVAPNGDGFQVDPPDPGGFGNSLGTTVSTYRITRDLEISLLILSPSRPVFAHTMICSYDSSGTLLGEDDSATYQTNRLETIPAGSPTRYRTRVLFDALLALHPTLDSVALIVDVGDAGTTPNSLTWLGSCIVSDAASDLDTVVAWSEVTGKPLTFSPSDAGVAELVNDSTTPSDTRAALDALYLAGAGLDDAGVAALVADDTTPSDTRAALDALPLDTFAAPGADVSMGSHKLTNVTDPASAQDAATKNYVDGIISGGPGGATDAATAGLVADRTSDTGEALDLLYANRMGNAVQRSVAAIVPIPGATAPSFIGIPAVTATGSGFAISPSTGSKHSSSKRLAYIRTSAATTNVAGWSGSIAYLWRGNAAGLGGFRAEFRFGPHSGQTIAGRMFTGLTVSTAAPTDVEPSTLVSMIGVGFDAADTQLYVMHNDSSGTATKVATGLTRSSVDASQVYTLTIECAPNGSTVAVTVVDEVAATTFTTTLSTDLPASTSFMVPRSWTSVGGVSALTGMALMGYYSESAY